MARWVGIGTQQPRAGFETMTSWSQVRHRSTRPPCTNGNEVYVEHIKWRHQGLELSLTSLVKYTRYNVRRFVDEAANTTDFIFIWYDSCTVLLASDWWVTISSLSDQSSVAVFDWTPYSACSMVCEYVKRNKSMLMCMANRCSNGSNVDFKYTRWTICMIGVVMPTPPISCGVQSSGWG